MKVQDLLFIKHHIWCIIIIVVDDA